MLTFSRPLWQRIKSYNSFAIRNRRLTNPRWTGKATGSMSHTPDWIPSGCGSIRTVHVDALLPAEVNIAFDGRRVFTLEVHCPFLFPSLVCSQASWLLVYLPTLMEEGRRSRNSL
ncbi:hypothetical protein V6N13_005692 [Hibiscus sabdariffa]